jgi:hypothetical protein
MNNTHHTKDLAEAAFLYASGRKLAELKKDSGKYWFVFDDRKTCQALVDSYWRKDASVNAKEYADAFRSLKDLIFNKKG